MSDWAGDQAHPGFAQLLEDITAALGEAPPREQVPDPEAKPAKSAQRAVEPKVKKAGDPPQDLAMVMSNAELRRRLVPPDRRIFLSYARLDDEVHALDREARGWVRYFYDQLQLALRHRLGSEIEFWRDRKDIDENQPFEDLIEEGLEGSTHLLAVGSPGYLKSKWCKRELQRFVEKRGGETRETIERVIKVLKHRMDETSLPPVLQKREGYRFFAIDPDHPNREVPFYLNGKMRREPEYLDVIERLAEYLVRHCLD